MRISDWSSDVCSSDLDVAHGGDDQRVLVGLHRAEADGDGKLAAVGAAAGKLEVLAHRAHTWRDEEVTSVADVKRLQRLRHQHLDRLPDELVAGIAEQMLSLRIDQNDASLTVGDHDAVGSGFEQGAEVCFAARPRRGGGSEEHT